MKSDIAELHLRWSNDTDRYLSDTELCILINYLVNLYNYFTTMGHQMVSSWALKELESMYRAAEARGIAEICYLSLN